MASPLLLVVYYLACLNALASGFQLHGVGSLAAHRLAKGSMQQRQVEQPSMIHSRRRSFSMTATPLEARARGRLDLSRALPQHPELVQGKLDNGFTYIILPNAIPAGRFEAHLEVLSGSAHELERQQGIAHLLEHVSYMGSPKRQLISGTGSRTNAYTDFHHTVFFAACPTSTPDQFWKKPMLPMALDALLDVMTTQVDDDRLEKERAAVLSEASMVNKVSSHLPLPAPFVLLPEPEPKKKKP